MLCGVTLLISQDITNTEHLGDKDTNGDEKLRHYSDGPPVILGCDFS